MNIRLLDHRDVYRHYYAVVVDGVDYATTDSQEKAEEIATALMLFRGAAD